MDRREIISDILILVIVTAVGLGIAIFWNGLPTQVLFIVMEALAFLYIIRTHKDAVYCCTECGTKHKLGLIPDLESPTMENGDKIVKCKKCKKKTVFRKA